MSKNTANSKPVPNMERKTSGRIIPLPETTAPDALQGVSIDNSAEYIGQAVIDAIKSRAVVIILPSNPSAYENALVVIEGELADDLSDLQKMLAEVPSRLEASATIVNCP